MIQLLKINNHKGHYELHKGLKGFCPMPYLRCIKLLFLPVTIPDFKATAAEQKQNKQQ